MNLHLTRITLNPEHRDAVADREDTHRLHRRLMLLAPDDLGDNARSQAGLLFRVEEADGETKVVVQTRTRPDVHRMPVGYGQIDTFDITPLLERLTAGVTVEYRIVVNPTKRLASADKIQLLKGEAADEWWEEKAAANGLDLDDFDAEALPDAIGKKGPDPKRWIRHVLRRFDGTATITDAEAVREALLGGIGRAKAYGAGLLSLRVLD